MQKILFVFWAELKVSKHRGSLAKSRANRDDAQIFPWINYDEKTDHVVKLLKAKFNCRNVYISEEGGYFASLRALASSLTSREQRVSF